PDPGRDRRSPEGAVGDSQVTDATRVSEATRRSWRPDVRVQHHPDCATLMAYASGTLGEALSVVVACHVAWCPSCQRELRRHEETGGAIIEAIDSVPVNENCWQAVLS